METRLVLVRHGESQAQLAGRLTGHDNCEGLTELGRTQVAALRDRLLETRELGEVGALFASKLLRAIQTAEILSPALGHLPPDPECDWCELHVGAAEGLTFKELRERYPLDGDPDDPFTRGVPDGETWAELYERIGTRAQRIAQEHRGQTVVVACHGGTIGGSLVALGNMPIGAGVTLARETVNASITEWRFDDRRGWRLNRYNDSAHLSRSTP